MTAGATCVGGGIVGGGGEDFRLGVSATLVARPTTRGCGGGVGVGVGGCRSGVDVVLPTAAAGASESVSESATNVTSHRWMKALLLVGATTLVGVGGAVLVLRQLRSRDGTQPTTTTTTATTSTTTPPTTPGGPDTDTNADDANSTNNSDSDSDDDDEQETRERDERLRVLIERAEEAKERQAFHEVERLYNQALALSERSVGVDHPLIALILSPLGGVSSALEKYALAEQQLTRALAIAEKHDMDCVEAMASLAEVYVKLNRFDRAEPLCRASLEMQEARDPDHPHVALILDIYSTVKIKQKQLDVAEEMVHRVLTMFKNIVGETDPMTVQVFAKLGQIYLLQGKEEQAQTLFHSLVKEQEDLVGVDHPFFAFLINYIGSINFDAQNFEAAEPLLEYSLELKKGSTVPVSSSDLASIQNDLATLYRAIGENEKSESLLREIDFSDLERPPPVTTGRYLQALGSEVDIPPPGEESTLSFRLRDELDTFDLREGAVLELTYSNVSDSDSFSSARTLLTVTSDQLLDSIVRVPVMLLPPRGKVARVDVQIFSDSSREELLETHHQFYRRVAHPAAHES